MLKLSKPISAEKVRDYYAVEFGAADQSAYFSQGGQVRGEWHGRLAAQFGLVGGVHDLHYYRLAEGQHPHSGAQLIKHRKVAAEVAPVAEPSWMTDKAAWKEHIESLFALSERMRLPEEWRAELDAKDPIEFEPPPEGSERTEPPKKTHAAHVSAYDFTVGAPKSYSATALIGGDARLIADHKAAVRIALDAGEAYTQARLRDTAPITSANWCGALFLHDTARPVDGNAPNPHLHTHAVVFNMTDAAGKVRSVQPWEWYRVQSYISAVYQSEIAYRAMARGYELEHGRNFSTQIKGYSQEYLDAISARTKEIEAEKERLGIVGAESDERVNKRLRKPKQEWVPEALKAEHRRQAEEMGQDPERIVAASRQREVRMLTPEERLQLAHKAIDHARDRLMEHQAVNDHYEIMRDALRFGLGHIRLQDVEAAFGQRREFVQVGHHRENAPGARYSTIEMRQMERDTIRMMLAGQGTVQPIAAELTKDQFREQYQERHRGEEKIVPNGDQMRLGYNVLTSPHQGMLVRGAAGSGKCFQVGTNILLFCGCVRAVEDIQIGDQVMGPDSRPRNVLGLARGVDEMYRVVPTKGEPYVVNGAHILSLQMTGRYRRLRTGNKGIRYRKGAIVNISVDDYLRRGFNFKHDAKGWRTGVEFTSKPIEMEAYFLGVWLGDGSSRDAAITSGDREIAEYLKGYGQRLNLQVTEWAKKKGSSRYGISKGNNGLGLTRKARENPLLNELRRLKLINNKHVPRVYLANTRAVRLEVLAGLLDSDGHHQRNCYSLTFKSLRLSEDAAFLARSLGLAAYVVPCRKVCVNNGKEGQYYRVSISGDISEVPVKLCRRKAEKRKQVKSVLRTGIKIEAVGPGEYVGFQVDGDGLFLLGDFTVTHNSTAMEPIAEVAAARGYEVLGLASASKAAENLRKLGIEPSTIQAHNLTPVDPAERKRLYILDEGSLIGTRQFHKFVKSIRPRDRYVIAHDHRQHQAVEAGRIIEEMEQAGVATFALEKIVRQRDSPELLAVINEFKDGRMPEGLRMLDEHGGIHQVPDRQKRLEYMAMWYVREPDTLMVAPDNRTIGELNAAARSELRKAGRLGPDVYEARVLVGVRDVREADRKRAFSYEAGNVIRWGKGVKGLGVASGDYTPVVRTDISLNKVTIRVGKLEVEYDPHLAYGVEIYEAERRKLAVGERIQVTRPWKLSEHVRIPNRATGVIREMDEAGNAKLEMEDGRRVKWSARRMPHIDWAYAMTSHSLQYATAERVLLHLDMGDSRIRTLMDKALVYVGLSRGSHEMQVFTDDREMLLSTESPILRENVKPKALAKHEIESIGIGMAS